MDNNHSEEDNPKAVEKKLTTLFNKYGVGQKITASAVKKWIYNERDKKLKNFHLLQKKFLSFFPKTKNIDKLNDILQNFTSAWNAFPHKTLHGKSPNEMAREELVKRPSLNKKDNTTMPMMIVDGRKMQWDEYWAMIHEMEKIQIPFKNWIEKEVLPKYKKYLQSTASQSKKTQHYKVADIFFDRVRYVGFLELGQIRKDFIQKEFPQWWQTHVLDSNVSEQQIRTSLKKLFEFLELVYEIQPKKFGF